MMNKDDHREPPASGTQAALKISPFTERDRDECLTLFDANCPTYFAPNERGEYECFLSLDGGTYQLVKLDGRLCGAFAVTAANSDRARLNWIMVSPSVHGSGIGRVIMTATVQRARQLKASAVDIAASHLSAPFFARFGAVERFRREDGWGPGMHRVDMELPIEPAVRMSGD